MEPGSIEPRHGQQPTLELRPKI